jgi:hypothetical protein
VSGLGWWFTLRIFAIKEEVQKDREMFNLKYNILCHICLKLPIFPYFSLSQYDKFWPMKCELVR